MDELGRIGVVVSGAVPARAVPNTDTDAVASDGHSHETVCLNCATALTGEYCHACGQHAHLHRTLGAFVHDLLHGVLHFEGKIWRTLPLLAWKPGDLTRRYIKGQRASFISPIGLFLFAVFLMFATVSSMGIPVDVNSDQIKSEITADAIKAEQAIKTLQERRDNARAAGKPTLEVERQITDAREEASLLREMAGRGLARGAMIRVSDDVPAWLAAPLRHTASNPELLLYKLQNNAYKYSWVLIPVSLPFMWLLFPFSRRFRLYDHIVFVTYSLAFMTLLVVVASLLYFAGLQTLAGFVLLLPPFHMFRQLKAAYDLGWWGALGRTILLVSFAMVAVGFFVAALFAVGLF